MKSPLHVAILALLLPVTGVIAAAGSVRGAPYPAEGLWATIRRGPLPGGVVTSEFLVVPQGYQANRRPSSSMTR